MRQKIIDYLEKVRVGEVNVISYLKDNTPCAAFYNIYAEISGKRNDVPCALFGSSLRKLVDDGVVAKQYFRVDNTHAYYLSPTYHAEDTNNSAKIARAFILKEVDNLREANRYLTSFVDIDIGPEFAHNRELYDVALNRVLLQVSNFVKVFDCYAKDCVLEVE